MDAAKGPKVIEKLKSAADKTVTGVNAASGWKQPLKRHLNRTTKEVEFISVLIRILNGEAGKSLLIKSKICN